MIYNVFLMKSATIKRHIYILLAASLTWVHAYAHEDRHIVNDFGNIKTRIITGFEYEEINNVALLGRLAEKLAKELDYSDLIFLDFRHDYIGKDASVSFISYDKGAIESFRSAMAYKMGSDGKLVRNPQSDTNSVKEEFLEENAIVVRQISGHFDAQTTMKLLEYAILNLTKIQSSQQPIEYKKSKFNSIDTLVIKKLMNAPNSELLSKLMKVRINRHEENFKYGISYYLQDNRYYVFQKGMYQGLETVLFDFEHIYDFKKIGNMSALIFDTDSSFYYTALSGIINFGGTGGKEQGAKILQRQIINNRGGYRPVTVVGIGGEKIAITFSYFAEWKEDENSEYTAVGDKERTLIYFTKKDKLIQDLDKLLEK